LFVGLADGTVSVRSLKVSYPSYLIDVFVGLKCFHTTENVTLREKTIYSVILFRLLTIVIHALNYFFKTNA